MTKPNVKISDQWKDVVNLVLGLWLVVSPWVLNYVTTPNAAWSAWAVGAVISYAAFAALVALQKREEWVNAVLAGWLIVSPFMLGFGTNTATTWNQIIVGAIVGALAIWASATMTDPGGYATRS
ncbi:MAG: SPW repeat protein [Rhizobiales bacterium]|nr:SPW repeat protein [Hyphomicrobiales bacterium]MBI3674411.1 SPW repeat protein [Hyphomicrobiales bacterium]